MVDAIKRRLKFLASWTAGMRRCFTIVPRPPPTCKTSGTDEFKSFRATERIYNFAQHFNATFEGGTISPYRRTEPFAA
ncbi:hypothetical protein K443DRAFT_420730 [Laccaria amethystina LaAM-08-1]|uniref:Uncharacterized protein n=1 Tax=Laccaria amethystina LaAM-08-1 TaxID=1095629 RepID=A0A0C9WPF3_9AGAR|nr:hypothetical protein K443DRAFT_420730 [Laccaria amethystina LaAM-08-1]